MRTGPRHDFVVKGSVPRRFFQSNFPYVGWVHRHPSMLAHVDFDATMLPFRRNICGQP